MYKILIITLFTLFFNNFSFDHTQNFEAKNRDTIPQIYLPDYFNQFGYVHGRLAFSPNGNEAFWVITTSRLEKRFIIKKLNDTTWSEPENSFLNVNYKETSPCYSPDGQRVYYQSRYNKDDKEILKDLDIFYRERKESGWGEPLNIGLPINTKADEGRPWIGKDGTLWFTRNSESTKSDIYYSKYENGKYSEPIKLNGNINSVYEDTEPIISQDGRYLLFISNRPAGYSKMMNLYVCFKNTDNSWSHPECLSSYLKIENIWFPSISYDGKYLFFCGGFPTEKGYDKSNYYVISTYFIRNKQINFMNN
ncbi:MAG: hypothetical protein RBT46_09530 [Weeksellaceae bacterium]|jgi:Tol biopolymer transport system component|nr:hypothetical protein [Weeksellaceae bacterium]